jgi:hypothetical protein
MKPLQSLTRSSLALIFSLGASFACADELPPMLVAVKGDIKGAGQGASIPRPIPLRAPVVTGADSAAMIVPFPGQALFVDQRTELSVKSCTVTGGSGDAVTKSFVGHLQKGHLHSSIAASKKTTSLHEVTTPAGSYKAHGTSWSTWTGPGGDKAAVYAGTVTAQIGGASVQLSAGQVAFVTGSGQDAKVVVVDLKTGLRVTYTNGVAGDSELATIDELKQARETFESGLAAFGATASDADKISYALILQQINKTLADNMLAQLPLTQQSELFTNPLQKGITTPQNLASPEKPVE